MIPDEFVDELLHGEKWWHKAARRSVEKGQYRIISDREGIDPYMIRFYLHPRLLMLGLFRVVLHRFVRSDSPLDGLHDHPWPFVSHILAGGYREHLDGGRCLTRMPGDTIFSSARKRHRVELLREHRYVAPDIKFVPGELVNIERAVNPILIDRGEQPEKACWTLVIMGPKVRRWGFWISENGNPRRFYPWREWIAKRKGARP